MTATYYNEIDPFAVNRLRDLISNGHIPYGHVDDRSIWDVSPNDLQGYSQCHFFAGIGGWPLALKLAGWPDDKPVWTGSCPCQPFSTAGKGLGFTDERHLWPAWHWLIAKRKPDIIFGEQVDKAIGKHWLDLVSTDLEGVGYAIGPIVLPASSVGAPHARHRLWFVAGAVANSKSWRNIGQCKGGSVQVVQLSGEVDGLGQPNSNRCQQRGLAPTSPGQGHPAQSAGRGPWSDIEWLHCTDGKQRPTKPGIRPLAHGIPNRVGLIRGYATPSSHKSPKA